MSNTSYRHLEDEYYLHTDTIDENKMNILEGLFAKDLNYFKDRCENNALKKHAEYMERPIPNLNLRLAQIIPVMMSAINPRIFVGDKPGLGKTVISAESYAYYKMRCIKKGIEPKKCLVVTKSTHVQGFANEWNSFGIKLLPLANGTAKINSTLKKNDYTEFDGIVTNWDSLKTNGFLEFYLEHAEDFDYGVFDETSYLINDKTALYKSCDLVINSYMGGLTHCMFLNGSSFEKGIFDFYNQFRVIAPKLIPSKTFLERRYVVRTGRNIFIRNWKTVSNVSSEAILKSRTGEITDYVNQEELKDRLKYYYIARSKSDYYTDIPKHNTKLHGITMTPQQIKSLKNSLHVSLLNSPTTRNPDAKFDMNSNPKLKAIVEFADISIEDRPLIYAYNKESQSKLKSELIKLGHRVDILNGDTKDKQGIIDLFNNKELDILVTNVDSAVNIPTSDRILFYDIPTNPQKTTQICGRIDRNNDTVIKFFDFFCYLYSPEMNNIFVNGYFREKHANKFTGQESNQYRDLLSQLDVILSDTDVFEEYKRLFDLQEEKIQNLVNDTSKLDNIISELNTI